jgi:hypothetical protein
MIRPAKHADAPKIIEVSVASVSVNPLPVKIDRQAMAEMARQMIGNPQHFVWVAEQDGEVTACVAAMVQPGFWFRGLQASVVLFYGQNIGGVARILRRFAEWVKSRAGIKMAVFQLEPEADPRLAQFLEKLGFCRESKNFTFVRST